MSQHLCRLLERNGRILFERESLDIHGKLEPKDDRTYQIYLRTDNPDISNLQVELGFIKEALREFQSRLPYNIKVFSTLPYPLTLADVDVTIDFIEPDSYMTGNVLAWGGYPNGSLRGQMKLNNKYTWLDGFNKTGYELSMLGISLPGMTDAGVYQTYNTRQTVKHEFGHVLGLDHDTEPLSVMGAIYHVLNLMFSLVSLQALDNKYGLRSVSSRFLNYMKLRIQRKHF